MTSATSDILSILPHRPPMLLIDQVLELTEGQQASAQVFINPEWDIFAGHFPLHPLLPGIYLTEILAQTAGVMLLSVPAHRECLPVLFEINHMRFLHPVHPGDTLRTEAALKMVSENMYVCKVSAWMGERRVAKGELTMVLVAHQDHT